MSDIVVYSLVKAPISYIGELVSEEAGKVKMQRVLTLIADPRQGEKVTITSVPFASRDSVVSFNTSDLEGVMVSNPDPELIQHYQTEIISSYSKLAMVK